MDGSRFAELVFWFPDDGENLPEAAPEGIVFGQDRNGSSWASLSVREPDDSWIGVHLGELWDVAGAWLQRLAAAGKRPKFLILRVVAYARPNDAESPGFDVNGKWIEVLGQLGGDLDLDLYCYSARDSQDSDGSRRSES